MPVDKKLIRKKINELKKNIRELEKFRKKPLAYFEKSISEAWAVEHGLQLSIQIVIDVGNSILAALNINNIENYTDVIRKLGSAKVIPVAFSRKIQGMAGFRNVLVHEYAEVDLKVVCQILHRHLPDFQSFIRHVEKFLKKTK